MKVTSEATAPNPDAIPHASASASRLILDTNVWLDWLVFDDPRLAALAQAVDTGRIHLHATSAMLDEFASVVVRPHFGLDREGCAAACERQRSRVLLHEPAPDCRLPCTDPDDRMFIDLAIALRVDWLLSRDKALLRLRRIAGRRFAVRIGTPEDWRAAQVPPPIIDTTPSDRP
ncbi:MAG: PIN domain-containing protein [Burkholderiales bacterium]|nr:MAG: PIN domain-containing protein [Burkholderiales bacterium]